MPLHKLLPLVTLALALYPTPTEAQDKKPDPPAIKVIIGKEMPFHVADFVNGEHKDQGGCPGVMIRNAKAKGIIVWAVAADEPTLALARELDAVEPAAAPRFLVIWNRKANKTDLADTVTKAALKNTTAGLGRMSYIEPELAYRFGVGLKTVTVVSLLDQNQIHSFWIMTPGENTPEMRQKIVAETKAFLTGQ